VNKLRIDSTVLALTLISAISTLLSRVNPWPTDRWYETQYFLFGRFPGHDDYTPIAAPALLYKAVHAVAAASGLHLTGEFYLASAAQNLLLLLSACMIYSTLKLMRLGKFSTAAAICFLLLVLTTGLPQAFWSENVGLFLMSVVILTVATLLYGIGTSPQKFWILTILCGLSTGLLVVTRLTPVFLIPIIALLLFRRVPARQTVQITGTVTLMTLLLVTCSALANHARFGRYELSNSSGRHLWQGVKDISDRALADSSDYQTLKRLDPHIQGKNWWEIPPRSPDPVGYVQADPREPLLASLSRQAIRNSPAIYLHEGAYKFVRSVGSAPYRLGFDMGHWNPLNRADFLPPPSSAMRLPAIYGQTWDVVLGGVYTVFTWLYPISIFAIAISCLGMLAEYLYRLNSWMLSLAAFLCGGVILAAIPLANSGLSLRGIIGSIACASLLLIGTSILYEKFRASGFAPDQPGASFPLPLAALFFGSLWFSWQVEAADTRNTLPYLPFWAIMLASVGAWWNAAYRWQVTCDSTLASSSVPLHRVT